MLQEIYEMKEFQDEQGHLIRARISIDPLTLDLSKKSEDTKYIGFFRVQTPRGSMEVPFEFPIGMNLAQCFDIFDEEAKKTYKDMEKKMNDKALEKKLIVPSNLNKSGIIV